MLQYYYWVCPPWQYLNGMISLSIGVNAPWSGNPNHQLLLRAFCIIIFASYRTSLYCYFALIIHYSCVFRWFTGLSYKVSPSVFNFWETRKSSILVFWCFRDLLDLNLIGDFYNVNILLREASGEVVAREGSHEAQTRLGGAAHKASRATRARLALGGRLASVFL
jgi:hypothetical protein